MYMKAVESYFIRDGLHDLGRKLLYPPVLLRMYYSGRRRRRRRRRHGKSALICAERSRAWDKPAVTVRVKTTVVYVAYKKTFSLDLWE